MADDFITAALRLFGEANFPIPDVELLRQLEAVAREYHTPPLTAQRLQDAREEFANGRECPDCGGLHRRRCPRVKSRTQRYEYPTGGSGPRLTVDQVTYFRPGTWETEDIVFPEDLYEDDPQ